MCDKRRRQAGEIDVTDAMLVAGEYELSRYYPDDECETTAQAAMRIYLAMRRAALAEISDCAGVRRSLFQRDRSRTS